MEEIADKFGRKFATVNDRLRKKLSKLTPQQLAYLLETDQPAMFRYGNNNINDDNWPEHLKSRSSLSKSQLSISDDDHGINVESDDSSQQQKQVKRDHRLICRNPNGRRNLKQKL